MSYLQKGGFIYWHDLPSPFQNGKLISQRRGLVLKMYRKNKKCYWCGEKTVLSAAPRPKDYIEPWNMATLDHAYSKFDIRRPLSSGKEDSLLSCKKCNNERSSKEISLRTSKISTEFKIIDFLK